MSKSLHGGYPTQKAAPRMPKGTPPAGYAFISLGVQLLNGDCLWDRAANRVNKPEIELRPGDVVEDALFDSHPWVRPLPADNSSAILSRVRAALGLGEEEDVVLIAQSYAAKNRNQFEMIGDLNKKALEQSKEIADLKAQVERLNGDVEYLRNIREGQSQNIQKLMKEADHNRHQLRVMQSNASGNAVLVGRYGFSKPVTIHGIGGKYVIVPGVGSFEAKDKKDGFGRTVFEQVGGI